MTIQLSKVIPRNKTEEKMVLHHVDIRSKDKIHPTEKVLRKINHEDKNRSKQNFRDIAVHHQYILNLNFSKFK